MKFMLPSRLLVVVAITFATSGVPARAAKDDDLIPSTAESLSGLIAGELQNAAANAATARASVVNMSQDIARAREAYWSAYPDGADLDAARREYQRLLVAKDTYQFLMEYIEQQVEGGDPQMRQFIERIVTPLDGGIRPEVRYEFRRWVGAAQAKVPYKRFISDPSALWEAAFTGAGKERYIAYAMRRDLEELYRGPKSPFRGQTDPRTFYIAFQAYGGRVGTAREAGELYDLDCELFGKETVHAAVADLRALPTADDGTQVVIGTKEHPITIGRHLQFPRVLANRVMATDDDRAKAMLVLDPVDKWGLSPVQVKRRTAERYKTAVEKFGVERVHAAGRKIVAMRAEGKHGWFNDELPLDPPEVAGRPGVFGLNPKRGQQIQRLVTTDDGALMVEATTQNDPGPFYRVEPGGDGSDYRPADPMVDRAKTARSESAIEAVVLAHYKALPDNDRMPLNKGWEYSARNFIPQAVPAPDGRFILIVKPLGMSSVRVANVDATGTGKTLYQSETGKDRYEPVMLPPLVTPDGTVFLLVRIGLANEVALLRIKPTGGAERIAAWPNELGVPHPREPLALHPDGRIYGVTTENWTDINRPRPVNLPMTKVLFRIDPRNGKFETLARSSDPKDPNLPLGPICITRDGSIYWINATDEKAGPRLIRHASAVVASPKR